MWCQAVRVGHQVRRALRMAELLRTRGGRADRGDDRQVALHGEDRGDVRELRRAPWPRLPRTPPAGRPAPLHPLPLDQTPPQGIKRQLPPTYERWAESRAGPQG